MNINDTITFTVNVTNDGQFNATNVTITDVVPEQFGNVTFNGSVVSDNVISFVIDRLDVGQSYAFNFTAIALVSGTWNNTASTYCHENATIKEDNATVIVDPAADLEVNKTVSDSTARFGDVITWTITVRNKGPDIAVDAWVDDVVPPELVDVAVARVDQGSFANNVWTIGNLTSGQVVQLVLSTKVNATNVTIVNNVTVNSTTYDPNETNNNGTNNTVIPPEADLSIFKGAYVTETHIGDAVVWTIVVTNNGPDVAVNVTVSDVIPVELTFSGVYTADRGSFDGSTWSDIGDLAVGESVSLIIETNVVKSNANITNVVTVNSTTYDPNETNNEDNDTVEIPPEADLEIVKVANVTEARVGDVVEWTIVVTNNGPDAAVNVTVSDVIPNELVNVAVVSIDDGSFENNVWSIDRLEAKGSLILVINTTVAKSNVNITNVVTVTSDTYDPNETNNGDNDTVEIPPEADIEVIKAVLTESAHKGDIVEWVISVTNHGPDTAVNVVLDDVLPDGLIYNGTVNTPVGKLSADGKTWTIGNMTANQAVTLVIRTIVNATNMSAVNKANISSETYDPNMTNNNDSDVIVIPPEADLEVIKGALKESAHKGEIFEWFIIVINNGPDTAVNAVLDDVLPDELIYNGIVRIDAGELSADGKIWTIGNMTVGQRAYLRISTIVNTTNMSIVNEANVSSETHDPDMSNNNDSDFVVIPPEAELDINKTAEPGKVHYGDTVVFTIVVNNNGPDNATNVVIGDVVPEQFKVTDCNDSSFIDNQIIVDELKVGQSYIFTITTIAVANGTWNNTASAFCTENNTKVEDNATVIVDPIADLSTTITSDKDEYYVGDIATWTITVHNAGNGTDAIGVILEEFFPSQYFDFIGAMTDNGTYDNESDEWDIGFMGNGTDVTLYIVGRAKAPGNHINNRVVVASDTDEWDYYNNFAYNYVDVLDIPKPVKSVDNSTPDYHDFVVYNLTIENTNGKDYEENLTVIDSLPDGLVFNETLGISGADLISEVVDGQTVTWTITNISAESSAVITVKVYVNAVVNLTNNLTIVAHNGVNSTVNCTVVPEPVVDIFVNITSDQDEYYVNDVAVWTITVTNSPDSSNATNVSLKDILPPQFKYLDFETEFGTFDSDDNTWYIGDLSNGTTVTLKIYSRALTTGKDIDSVVQVKCSEKELNITNNVDDKMVDILDLPKPVKTVDNSTPYIKNFVVYNLTIENTNNVTYGDDLTVIDSLPAGLIFDGTVGVTGADLISEVVDGQTITWTINNIPAKSTAVITVKVFVNATGDLTNNLTIVYPNGADSTVNCTVTPAPMADLEVIITNNFEETNSSCHMGDEVVWTITVTNHGPNDAINTILKDVLPDGLIYISDDSDGAYDNENAVWTIGDLPVGETVTLTIRTLVNTSGVTITKNVTVSSDTYDPNLSNNKDKSAVDVLAEADLEVTKSVSNKAPHKNDKITWTIIVTNNGRDTAENAVVTDKLPSGLVYVSDDSNGAYDYETGIWTVGDLANGESATLNIVTLVTTTNKTIINVADVTSDTYDPNETNNKCNNSTDVPPEADLVITVDPSATLVKVGDKIVFTVTVVNQGPDTAVNSRAFINLPDELKLLGFKPSKGTYDPETGIWTIGDLAPGEKVTLILDTEALASGKFVVEAYTECDTYESDLTNNFDDTEVEVIEEPPVEPEEPPINVPVPPTMHPTGNPIVMILLSLLAIVGISFKRKS